MITNVWAAAPFLILLGAIGGYMVVPMNALLQHRGANLMGAGRSIAVQNFNEQACILGLGAFYTGMTRFSASGVSARSPSSAWWWPAPWRGSGAGTRATASCHRGEVERLLALARRDKH